MGKKLYVGNLPFTTTDKNLSDMFSQCGTVDSVKIVMDRDIGRSKGFGFVEMSSASEAQEAIDTFNGHELDGRAMVVNEAKPMPERDNNRGGGFGGGGGGRNNSRNRW